MAKTNRNAIARKMAEGQAKSRVFQQERDPLFQWWESAFGEMEDDDKDDSGDVPYDDNWEALDKNSFKQNETEEEAGENNIRKSTQVKTTQKEIIYLGKFFQSIIPAKEMAEWVGAGRISFEDAEIKAATLPKNRILNDNELIAQVLGRRIQIYLENLSRHSEGKTGKERDGKKKEMDELDKWAVTNGFIEARKTLMRNEARASIILSLIWAELAVIKAIADSARKQVNWYEVRAAYCAALPARFRAEKISSKSNPHPRSIACKEDDEQMQKSSDDILPKFEKDSEEDKPALLQSRRRIQNDDDKEQQEASEEHEEASEEHNELDNQGSSPDSRFKGILFGEAGAAITAKFLEALRTHDSLSHVLKGAIYIDGTECPIVNFKEKPEGIFWVTISSQKTAHGDVDLLKQVLYDVLIKERIIPSSFSHGEVSHSRLSFICIKAELSQQV